MSDFFIVDRELEWPTAAAALVVSVLPLIAFVAVAHRALERFFLEADNPARLTSDQREAYPADRAFACRRHQSGVLGQGAGRRGDFAALPGFTLFYDFPFRDVGGKSSLSCVRS